MSQRARASLTGVAGYGLRDLGLMTHDEVAVRLGLSRATVQMIEACALAKIRRALGVPQAIPKGRAVQEAVSRALGGHRAEREPFRCTTCGRRGHNARVCRGESA